VSIIRDGMKAMGIVLIYQKLEMTLESWLLYKYIVGDNPITRRRGKNCNNRLPVFTSRQARTSSSTGLSSRLKAGVIAAAAGTRK
jgi:hypothetical protein